MNPVVRPERGFTLIELMIVVAIVGILAMIAYPSYQDQIRKSRRADAQSVLMQNAQFMERLYSELGCYDAGADNDTCGAGEPGLPFDKSPIDGADQYYVIAPVAGVTATAFTLQATPEGPQAVDGLIQINNLGQKFWDKNGDGDVADDGENNWSK